MTRLIYATCVLSVALIALGTLYTKEIFSLQSIIISILGGLIFGFWLGRFVTPVYRFYAGGILAFIEGPQWSLRFTNDEFDHRVRMLNAEAALTML